MIASAIDGVLPPSPQLVPRAQVALVRRNALDGALGEPLLFIVRQAQLQGLDDDPGDVLLNGEYVLDGAVESFGP